jgi:hypothetical protein
MRMLHKSFISNIKIYSDEWHMIRSGRLTSSRIHVLMGEKALSQGAMSYIYQKAGEAITGHNTEGPDDEVEDENTAWGVQYEPEALNKFGLTMGLKYLVVQKVIFDPAGRSSSTPDGIWIIDSSVTQEDSYNVATIEVKCPRKYPRFFPLFSVNTPQELKVKNPAYFWQVIDQMSTCGAAVGYFVVYNPMFPAHKNLKIVEFKKIDLWEDFKKLEQRKKEAIQTLSGIILSWKP